MYETVSFPQCQTSGITFAYSGLPETRLQANSYVGKSSNYVNALAQQVRIQ